MAVDVITEIVIDRPRPEVAGYAEDPGRAPEWYANITAVRWESEPPLRVGSSLAIEATFLGRRLAYTYEVVERIPGELLVMRTSQGPFPMETSYRWADAGPAATRMTLRNRGAATGFARLGAPVLAASMRRANQADLARLKSLLESRRP